MRIISETARHMQKDVELRFKDYAIAFDKLREKDLFQLLGKLYCFMKDIETMHNVYY